MSERPMTEGERAHAVQLATWIVEDKAPLMRAGNTSFHDVVNLARALLSTSAAERGLREALKELVAVMDEAFPALAKSGLGPMERARAALFPKGEG